MDVSDFFFFSAGGRGRGESEAPEGWVILSFFFTQEGGGSSSRGGGAEGLRGCVWGFWGGGALIFVFGVEIPSKSSSVGIAPHHSSLKLKLRNAKANIRARMAD